MCWSENAESWRSHLSLISSPIWVPDELPLKVEVQHALLLRAHRFGMIVFDCPLEGDKSILAIDHFD